MLNYPNTINPETKNIINTYFNEIAAYYNSEEFDAETAELMIEKFAMEFRTYIAANVDSKTYYRTSEKIVDFVISNYINTVSGISFDIGCLLPHRSNTSNAFVKDVVYDLLNSNLKQNQFNCREKMLVIITEYMRPTKAGLIRRDVDNSDKKGIVDAISQAFNVDDNGSNVSVLSEITKLPDGKKPYTNVTIVHRSDYGYIK